MEKSKTYFAAEHLPVRLMNPWQRLSKTLCLIVTGSLLLVPTLSQAETLQNFEAVYIIEKYNSSVGLATYQLKREADQVHFSMRTKLTGIAALFRNDRVAEDSWLTESENGLQLQRYSYQQTGSKNNRNTKLTLTWPNDGRTGAAYGTYAGKPVNLDVPANVYDALSFQLALMQNAANDSSLNFEVLSKDELKHYAFRRIGVETLKIAQFNIETTIVERQQDDRTTRLWLANNFQYLPVKIEQTDEGKSDTRMLIDKLILSGKQVL